MTGRMVGRQLRRSPAVLLALVTGAICTGLLISFPQGIEGRWIQLAVSSRAVLLLFLPLVLAGGAWLGRRDSLYRVHELFATTARPRWQRALPAAAAYALAVVTAYLAMFLVGATWVAPTSRYLPPGAIAAVAVGALSLVAAGWLGMAAGRAAPRLVTAPALAVLAAGLVGVLPMLVNDLNVGSEPGALSPTWLLSPVLGEINDFQTIAAHVHVGQALWLTALAVTGLLLLTAPNRRTIAAGVLPALLGTAIAVPLLPPGGHRAAAVFDPEAAELTCDNAGPQVCLTRAHAYLLPEFSRVARHAMTTLAAKLPQAPTRAVEIVRIPAWAGSGHDRGPARYPADTLAFSLADFTNTTRADLADADFLRMLVQAAWTPDCGTATDDRTGQDGSGYILQEVAVAWSSDRPTFDHVRSDGIRREAERVYRDLASVPVTEQARRMAQARQAVLACRDDALASISTSDRP